MPSPDLFWHCSDLHGQAPVSRVMVHAIRLVETTGQRALAARLWATVFPHDLARLHDGECHRHGADAFFDETDGAIAVGERHFE